MRGSSDKCINIGDGRSNWLVAPPTLHREVPPELRVLHSSMRAANHKTYCTDRCERATFGTPGQRTACAATQGMPVRPLREIPTDLKRAIITSIYKGGSTNIPKNYRPVVLTSHVIKILKKILAKNIHQFLERHQKMNPLATRLPLWQILPLPATGASQQDIRGIGKVKQCKHLLRFCKSVW